MKLYKSNDPDYLYAMKINKNYIYFGDPLALNMNNSNDKRKRIYIADSEARNDLKREYISLIDEKKLQQFNTKESFEFYLLYNKGNLKQSINDYTKIFGAYIKICKDEI